MPSRKRKTIRGHDGEGEEILPSEPTQFDPTIENQIISKKFRSFITNNLQRNDITAFDQQNLKFSLSADNKQMLIERMLRSEPLPFFNTKEDAYLFFDYKEEPKIPKIITKIKEKIIDVTQQEILTEFKGIAKIDFSSSSSSSSSSSTTAAATTKILTPSNIKLAISIKDISKNVVDLTSEQSIQQKIMQYTDFLTVLDDDEKLFPNYFTLLSQEIQKSDSKFTFLREFLGKNFNELKENINKKKKFLFTQLGIANRFNTIKDYNAYLSETMEPKIVREENKLKKKQEQAEILQSDLVILLFRLNDSLPLKIKIKNDYIKLYDVLLQIKKFDHFKSLFDRSPLEIIDFSPVKFDNIAILDIESNLSDSDKSAITNQLSDINTKSDIQKSRLAFVTDTNAKIDDEFNKIYGYSYDAGVKLLNQMIQLTKKALKQSSAYVVDDYIAKSKKPKVASSSLAVVAYEPPVAVAVAPLAASEPIIADSEPPVFQPLASSSAAESTTPSPLPFLQQIGKTTLRKSPPKQEKPAAKKSFFNTALLNKFKGSRGGDEEDGRRSSGGNKRKKSRQPTKKLNKKSCRNKVQENIKINLHSKKSVSYSQFPECIKYLLKKNL